jgi:hypothetical protein
MFLLDQIDQNEIDKLAPYSRKLFEALQPLIACIIPDTLDRNRSTIEILPSKRFHILEIEITAKAHRIPPLRMTSSGDYCILDLFEHEEVECHSSAERYGDRLIKDIVPLVSQYLSGITILEHYDKKNRVFRRDYYYGINTESIAKNRAGTWHHGFTFFLKAQSTNKITHSFYSQPSGEGS